MSENKLGNESSPYLLQHAQNPVHWYAWNEEALGRAKKENKPIFLSIGYSSCHWCHVMAHESLPSLFSLMKLYDGISYLYLHTSLELQSVAFVINLSNSGSLKNLSKSTA